MSIDYYTCGKCNKVLPSIKDYLSCKCGKVYCIDCEDTLIIKYGLSIYGELNACYSCTPPAVAGVIIQKIRDVLEKKYNCKNNETPVRRKISVDI